MPGRITRVLRIKCLHRRGRYCIDEFQEMQYAVCLADVRVSDYGPNCWGIRYHLQTKEHEWNIIVFKFYKKNFNIGGGNSTTAEEVSRFSSLIRTGWCGRASRRQKLAPIPMGITGWWRFSPLVVELNLVKCNHWFGCLSWRKRPTLA